MKGTVIGLTLASLIVATGGAASAETVEHTYVAPFQSAQGYMWGCAAPWCEGSISTDPSGEIVAEIRSTGVSRADTAEGILSVTHVIQEPATQVAIDVRIHVEDAYASAIGAPFASASADVAIDASPTSASWAYRYTQLSVAAAESPIGETQADEQDVTLSLLLGDG